jgi:hypothetical protein
MKMLFLCFSVRDGENSELLKLSQFLPLAPNSKRTRQSGSPLYPDCNGNLQFYAHELAWFRGVPPPPPGYTTTSTVHRLLSLNKQYRRTGHLLKSRLAMSLLWSLLCCCPRPSGLRKAGNSFLNLLHINPMLGGY